jgi:hypothetical protein
MVEGSSNLGAPSSPQGNPSLEITSHSLNGLKLFYPFKVKISHNVGFIYLWQEKEANIKAVVEEVEVHWSVELTITTKTLVLTNIDKDPVVAASASVACICCFGIVFARNDELITAL